MTRSETEVEKETLHEVRRCFEGLSGLRGVEFEMKERNDGLFLVMYIANPTERFYEILDRCTEETPSEALFPLRATIKKRPLADELGAAEARFLARELSEILAIDEHSFEEGFEERYIESVFGAEERIVSAANHVVYGRRGAGKSSLLLYARRKLREEGHYCAWIGMQVYSRRDDSGVAVDVLYEIISQVGEQIQGGAGFESLKSRLESLKKEGQNVEEAEVHSLLPDIKRVMGSVTERHREIYVFLDDFHVLEDSFQPELLETIYSVSRGNRVYLKISAIESFLKAWKPGSRVGLEIPHDAQAVKLDYNLTIPDKAKEHIRSILDAHAEYCGLPSIASLYTDAQVIDRLVWAAAGVPRDALSIFAQAMGKASLKEEGRVSVGHINIAASEMLDEKRRDMELDASGELSVAREVLDEIEEFCKQEARSNAFLVRKEDDEPLFEAVKQLIDLRFLHVLHEGITVRKAGERYMALILDYGFYVGVRAAPSVELFRAEDGVPKYDELRGLRVFRGSK